MNIIRSMKTKNLFNHDQNYVKENGWDDRFHVNRITTYDAQRDITSKI